MMCTQAGIIHTSWWEPCMIRTRGNTHMVAERLNYCCCRWYCYPYQRQIKTWYAFDRRLPRNNNVVKSTRNDYSDTLCIRTHSTCSPLHRRVNVNSLSVLCGILLNVSATQLSCTSIRLPWDCALRRRDCARIDGAGRNVRYPRVLSLGFHLRNFQETIYEYRIIIVFSKQYDSPGYCQYALIGQTARDRNVFTYICLHTRSDF